MAVEPDGSTSERGDGWGDDGQTGGERSAHGDPGWQAAAAEVGLFGGRLGDSHLEGGGDAERYQ
jgi:hypothetical protein